MRVLAAGIRANVPVLLWGNPGLAKTAMVTSHGEQWGYHVETIIGSIREPSDFMGLPIANDKGGVSYAPLDWAQRLVDADKGLLFLDELSTSPPSVQRAMLRIAQEREVGALTLPDSVAIVAAANPPEIAVDGWDLAAPIANRFMHVDWAFDIDGWLNGVATGFADTPAATLEELLGETSDKRRAMVYASVTAFIRNRADLLAPNPPTDPTVAGRAWPSPRSWTNAMAVLSAVGRDTDEISHMILTGCVGEGPAREYMAWEATMDLIDPDEALDDPDQVDWSNERPDRLFVLVSSVSSLVKFRGDKTSWNKGVNLLIACANGGKPDVAMPAAMRLLNEIPQGAKIPARARDAFSDILERTGRLAAAA